MAEITAGTAALYGALALSAASTTIAMTQGGSGTVTSPTIEIPETTSADVTEADADVTDTNAGVADEKRRLLSSLPKATQTNLGDTGDSGTVKKKTLLGSGSTTGSATLG